jgi:hypothetical protein
MQSPPPNESDTDKHMTEDKDDESIIEDKDNVNTENNEGQRSEHNGSSVDEEKAQLTRKTTKVKQASTTAAQLMTRAKMMISEPSLRRHKSRRKNSPTKNLRITNW